MAKIEPRKGRLLFGCKLRNGDCTLRNSARNMDAYIIGLEPDKPEDIPIWRGRLIQNRTDQIREDQSQ